MKHFHRTNVPPVLALSVADEFFEGSLGMARRASLERSRTYTGTLGTLTLSISPEGGHYTLIEADTDQMGESRLDRNVKRYFVRVHRAADARHRLTAAY